MAQSSIGLRAWAARQEALTPELREAEYKRQCEIAEESRRKAQERRREEDAEHERKRQWAEYTSNVERRITEIVDEVANANANDRTMMRAMLRYMNLGPGVGREWNAHTFALAYTASWRKSIFDMVLLDVIRCYDLLKNRYSL
jgi:hypothetical protein